jgi:hypothetical protein
VPATASKPPKTRAALPYFSHLDKLTTTARESAHVASRPHLRARQRKTEQAVPRKPTSKTKHAAACRRSYARHAAERRAGQNAKRDRNIARAQRLTGQIFLLDAVVTAAQLDAPRLYWLSPSGNLQLEEELSAEELIRRYNKERKVTTP